MSQGLAVFPWSRSGEETLPFWLNASHLERATNPRNRDICLVCFPEYEVPGPWSFRSLADHISFHEGRNLKLGM
ncbi:uncharacterized protein ANIA_11436 [Aspergillus nidulans FGSC A4]|uniref:Uncharacterized protein n=1 Tax=Emericella nidulans (strain FGSC A4 / ATCC 38163 / CBS 112.46 / NRRL 194 / M139) TaxID=227321 RepID=C8V8V6_EMENI|nr:hypothetical protein [Aspergillus nidulans FGSC A4]CBF77631.1 TPA: hypothetical protein ANIA_11436 [Aspergillus nidulans FGSC A4]